MGLMDRILSSRKQIAAYTVQPYKPFVIPAAYGNRNWSPEMVAPPVGDQEQLQFTAYPQVGNRNYSPTPSRPPVVILGNGVAPAAANNSPRRG